VIERDLARKVLAVAVAKGADYADLFAERAVHNLVLSDDRRLRTDLYTEHGVGIRVVVGDKTCYAIGDSFDEAALLKLAAYVRDAAGGAGRHDGIIDLRRRPARWPQPFAIAGASAATETKVELIRRGEEAAWSTPYCTQATIRHRDHEREVFLAGTLHDEIITQTLGLTEFAVMVILDRSGTRESGVRARSFYRGLEALTGKDSPEAMAAKAANIASTALEARDCPRGEMPVIFAPGENGILFHESCGHGMEADLVEKGSVFGGRIGETVASPLVSLVDDGTLIGYPGSFEFDDEGTPSQRTVLIDRGVLKTYLHSSVTARKAGAALTGSARRESYKYPPIPRMRNTFILAGDSDPEEIIRNTKRGLYAVDAGGGGQVNVFTGEFITSIKLGYMIEDGRLTYPVKGASIIGRGIDALRDIDMVGNDLEIIPMGGRCGKGQQVPVGVGMPTVRVKSLNVGGTGEAYDGGGA
jgi:TldD protein